MNHFKEDIGMEFEKLMREFPLKKAFINSS
jgi:hypothetical protein